MQVSAFFDHGIKPCMLAEHASAKLPLVMAIKVAAPRSTTRGKNLNAGKYCYMLAANPDRHVKHGQNVILLIATFRVEHPTLD